MKQDRITIPTDNEQIIDLLTDIKKELVHTFWIIVMSSIFIVQAILWGL